METVVLAGIVAGMKLAIFAVVLVYAWLAVRPFKLKGIHWLNLMAAALMVAAFGELLHFLADADSSYAFWPWIVPNENLHWFVDLTFVVAGVAIIQFFRHLGRHPKEYR